MCTILFFLTNKTNILIIITFLSIINEGLTTALKRATFLAGFANMKTVMRDLVMSACLKKLKKQEFKEKCFSHAP